MSRKIAAIPADYADWLADIKARVASARQRAALAANAELIRLYWQIGRDILDRQAQQGWGSKVIERLARDLRAAFPEMKGFSRANLLYMRAFAEAWPEAAIVQQTVGQLPWGHNVQLITRIKDPSLRLRYAEQARAEGWSRTTLELQIRNRLLLCRTKNRTVTEYALSGIDKPIGVAEYQLVRALPEPLVTSLPTVEELESELGAIGDEEAEAATGKRKLHVGDEESGEQE